MLHILEEQPDSAEEQPSVPGLVHQLAPTLEAADRTQVAPGTAGRSRPAAEVEGPNQMVLVEPELLTLHLAAVRPAGQLLAAFPVAPLAALPVVHLASEMLETALPAAVLAPETACPVVASPVVASPVAEPGNLVAACLEAAPVAFAQEPSLASHMVPLHLEEAEPIDFVLLPG